MPSWQQPGQRNGRVVEQGTYLGPFFSLSPVPDRVCRRTHKTKPNQTKPTKPNQRTVRFESKPVALATYQGELSTDQLFGHVDFESRTSYENALVSVRKSVEMLHVCASLAIDRSIDGT
jgi:hypothetical protein